MWTLILSLSAWVIAFSLGFVLGIMRTCTEASRSSAIARPMSTDVMVDLANDGMTMMVVTHEMGFAQKVADRVVFMDEGTIVEDAPKEEFFRAQGSERAQLFLSKILTH